MLEKFSPPSFRWLAIGLLRDVSDNHSWDELAGVQLVPDSADPATLRAAFNNLSAPGTPTDSALVIWGGVFWPFNQVIDNFRLWDDIQRMQTIEFNATVEDGVIPIPRQYKGSIAEKVRVIVFPQPEAEKPKKKKVYSIGIDMTGYKFNREEANERR